MSNIELNELLILAQAGNYDAFDALHAYLLPSLERFTRRLMGPGQEAEDIVQDTLIVLYTNLNRVRSGEHLRPYVLHVARYRCYDVLRHWKRFEQVPLGDTEQEQETVTLPNDSSPPPDEITHWMLLKAEVDEAIARLPEAQREVLMLFCEDELSYAEIAEVIGTTIGTVKSRLFYAKKTLRGMVHPEVLLAIQGEDNGRDDTTSTVFTGIQDSASFA